MDEHCQSMVPTPSWLDKPPEAWPAAARTAFDILSRGAERRLIAEATPKAPGSIVEERAA